MGAFNRGYAQSLHGFPLQAAITLCSAWAFTLFGYDQGVLGGLIALPSFLKANHISANDADLQGTIVAIYDIGCLTGCIIAGFVGQKLGRRIYIALGGVFLVVGAGLQAGARGSSYLIAGRVIGGIGMESPRYLYACGAVEDADNIMARIYSVRVDSAEVAKHRADVFAALEMEKEYKFSFKNLFYDTSPVNTTWRLWLGVLCQLLQQMDGNNIVSYVGLPLSVLPDIPTASPVQRRLC
ncbi:hypothetical protein LTR47_008603 [Exophiala xenobiotica]|nr:hypothetical protein LTR41_010291 [Exophiala xenobiotica]KAK5216371.1 hypothetical protein LTR72_010544 [Exophiala xenobiotica]KAK5227562.1 hypothetical protein LTR47_008603 [Exophiala xenobiotica]KAK5245604.1 hypothetical protein LTS06_008969 [Exophiala xenobiotica]KAK5289058.1 hypothetical protein LTR14_007890 [Exophiala xenobiotica]